MGNEAGIMREYEAIIVDIKLLNIYVIVLYSVNIVLLLFIIGCLKSYQLSTVTGVLTHV